MNYSYDVIVVGGGHSGLEAVVASSQFKELSILLITSPDVKIGSAPCNPAIGGVGKGQVVKEIDALGGIMGYLADLSGIQYRTLNESKGPAVQSTRVQIDKELYANEAENFISSIENLNIIRSLVKSVSKVEDLFHVELSTGEESDRYISKKIIITTGTFLGGLLHVGQEQKKGGRIGARESQSLGLIFKDKAYFGGRFKTGTPARIQASSLDFSRMDPQESDSLTRNFSYKSEPFARKIPQHKCFLAKTNARMMSVIRSNKERSPIFNGQIKGVGPRYCPSIEDKAFRYPDKNEHHVFVEPDSLSLGTVYPNGISSSLPKDIQLSFIRSMDGFENAEIETYGYAVEYDVVDTTKLDQTLQCKNEQGLYFAGQVCGTSGYEEAAGQGMVAGINAALSCLGREGLILDRNDSYIGVMIQDLVSNKRDEPYRLFTARSENRLKIREDNTLNRMANYRKSLKLNSKLDHYYKDYLFQFELLQELIQIKMYYSNEETKKIFLSNDWGALESNISLAELLRRPQLNPIKTLGQILLSEGLDFSYDVVRSVAISNKYDGYIVRSEVESEKIKKLASKKLNLEKILSSKNISFECLQRIKMIMPETFGQLQKIEGIRPATLTYIAGNIL